MKKSQRKVVVLTSLVTLLTLTSALLLAISPPPLSASGYNSLSAANRPEFLDEVFKTAVVPKLNQWKYIYIHQSHTRDGDANSLAVRGSGLCDHFIIGNGQGAEDGEILISPRWDHQLAAAPPPGVDKIDSNCVSVCLVGDFDQSTPTSIQLQRLTELVSTLQTQLRIGGDQIVILNDSVGASGIGKYFPIAGFKERILP